MNQPITCIKIGNLVSLWGLILHNFGTIAGKYFGCVFTEGHPTISDNKTFVEPWATKDIEAWKRFDFLFTVFTHIHTLINNNR